MPEPTSLMDVQPIQANGTVLHAETRGHGPTVLLIAGAGGDAAELGGLADALADEFCVTTYDRRGNSRCPRPAGWEQTSLAEQADDAAALLAALGHSPAVVVGTSVGGSIALELTLRHPIAVRAAIVHEPPILAGTTDPQAVTAAMAALIGQGMAAGGPPAAMELFLRWAAGDATFEATDPADRDRWLGNGEVFFGVEMASIMAYAPPGRGDRPRPTADRGRCLLRQPRPRQSPPLSLPGSGLAGPPGRRRPGRGPRRPHVLPHRPGGGGRVPAPAAATAQLSPGTRRGITDPARSRPPTTPTSNGQSPPGRRTEHALNLRGGLVPVDILQRQACPAHHPDRDRLRDRGRRSRTQASRQLLQQVLPAGERPVRRSERSRPGESTWKARSLSIGCKRL